MVEIIGRIHKVAKENAKKTTKESIVKRFRLPKLTRKSTKSEHGGYLAGAWNELRQVRWPDRKATWSLTLAVILFSVFFAGIILSLDYLYNELFRKVLL